MKTGIIYIVTSPSRKVYIGQTIQKLKDRRDKHYSDANNKRSRNHNTKFNRAIRKYGRNNFKWKILYYDIPIKYLNSMEIITIELYNSLNNGYNSLPGGSNVIGQNNPFYGKSHTENTKKQISKTIGNSRVGENNANAKLSTKDVIEIKTMYSSGEYIQSELAKIYKVDRSTISDIIIGKIWANTAKHLNDSLHKTRPSKSTSEKISKKNKEYWTDETKLMRSGINNHMYGKAHSDETKSKLSAANSGENSAMAKLTWQLVRKIREKYSSGKYTYRGLAKEYNINQATIGKIVNNKTWKE